ncbi:MAG: DEAD/DEAH box helicase [Geminicoccaceae bacterium]|nr:MAG: DEAD/DEAH box helicase [Geminicoccaceae bacterium]
MGIIRPCSRHSSPPRAPSGPNGCGAWRRSVSPPNAASCGRVEHPGPPASACRTGPFLLRDSHHPARSPGSLGTMDCWATTRLEADFRVGRGCCRVRRAVEGKAVDLAAKLELEEAWQTALILPAAHEDFRRPLTELRLPRPGEPTRLAFRLTVLEVHRSRGQGAAGGRLVARDAVGVVVICLLDPAVPETLLATVEPGRQALVLGRVNRHEAWTLHRAEVVDPRWEGRLRPLYPRVRGWTAGEVRRTVLDAVRRYGPGAAEHLARVVPDRARQGEPRPPDVRALGFLRLLHKAHLPATREEAEMVLTRLDEAAAHATAAALRQAAAGVEARWHGPVAIDDHLRRIPLALTPSQVQACREIAADLAASRPMRRLLFGDVGSGKTVVYGVVAAAAAEHGCKVGIMLPSTVLASQVHAEMLRWFSDRADDIALVTRTQGRKARAAAVVVGTTALLHRVLAERDFAIVDEQQRFGRAQRDALGGASAHVLEVTATPIPRSLALVQLGLTTVSRLEGTFVRKRIVTRLSRAAERRSLMAAALETVRSGGQVLVIYPARGANKSDVRSVEEEGGRWERHLPGRCRVIHGGLGETEKNEALTAMREGRADVLVATTVVEVGVDLPELRRVIVVHAERFGLTTLHQIRGRVARRGGLGHCDLYLPQPVGDESFERLLVLTREQDGLKIAEADLRLRDCGELLPEGARQHGSAGNLFPLRPLNIERVASVLGASGSMPARSSGAGG